MTFAFNDDDDNNNDKDKDNNNDSHRRRFHEYQKKKPTKKRERQNQGLLEVLSRSHSVKVTTPRGPPGVKRQNLKVTLEERGERLLTSS